MPEALLALDGWLLRTTLGGGVVLLIGTLWMAFTRQPVQRQRIGELALLAALLVAVPAALPSWWSLHGSTSPSTTSKALFGKPIQSTKFNSSTAETEDLVAVQDRAEEEDFDPQELINYLYTLKLEEAEEHDAARIVGPIENSSETNCTHSSTLPLWATWGKWVLRLIGFAYITLVVVLLIRCSIGYYGLWRFWRQRRPAPAHVHAALAELEPDIAHRPRIGVNSLVHGPVSYGLWKPTILLPPAFCNEGDPEKLRWILAHELTHLRRRDAWGCLLLALGGALYFHVPWFWWMKRHVRLAQEYLADAAAARIANAVEYAQYLVSLTTLTSRPTLASSQAAGVFETPSDLYRRVHMLLHQRNVIERGAPRWWTITAAASFLTLAACTAGVQLYADEPAQTQDVVLKIVTDDDDKDTDKKIIEKKTIRVDGKTVQSADGKTFVWTTDDDKGKGGTVHFQGFVSPEKQKAIEEALKKIDRLLEKSAKQLDENTRSQLEEVKKTLKTLKETNKVAWLGAMDAAKAGQNIARARVFEAVRDNEEAAKAMQGKIEAARAQALAHRDLAQATEKKAREAQEKALVRWKMAKDGDDKDAAIKELEKAIAEKERALKALKADGAQLTNRVRAFEAIPFVHSKEAVTATGKGRLGVVTVEIDGNLRGHLDLSDGQGLMLQEVIDPSPAWNSGNGLRSSDILVELAGKKVPSNNEQFRELVNKLDGGTYNAVVFRKGKKITINGIKLPGAEKNKKVTLLDGEKGANVILDYVAQPHAVARDLALKEHLVTNLQNKVKVDLLPELTLRASELARAKHHLDENKALLEVVHSKLAKGDMVKVQPAEIELKFKDAITKLDKVNLQDKVNLELDAHGLLKEHVVLDPGELKVDFVKPNVTFTMQGQQSSKPRVGVTLEEVPEAVASQIELAADRGLFVKEVIDGSAAQKAGILKNDILIEFADKPVTKDHSAFTQFVKELKPGKYTATVVRKGKEIRIRGINLEAVKTVTEEKKAKAKEWTVDGDDEKKEAEKEVARAKSRDKKEKEDFFPNARGRVFVPAQGNTSVTINNDQFTARKSDEGKTITVTGAMVNGKAEARNITIKTDDGEKKFKTIKDVPEEDRAAVEKMLTSFKGRTFQLQGNNNAFFNQGQLDKQLENQLKAFEKSMKQLGEDNPGFEQMERELERLREQLKKMRGGKNDE